MISSLKKQSIRFARICLAVIGFLLTSCIGDNMDDCPTDASLRFEYSLNEEYRDLFSEEITHLDLLAYDYNGDYHKTYRILQNQLQNGNTFPLDLEPGSYTLVVWANTTDALYQNNYTARIEDMRVRLNTTPSIEADPQHGSFFHGMKAINITDSRNEREVVSLTKNTHNLQITLEETGNNTNLAVDDYTIAIIGTNGSYNYENNTAGGDLLHYMPRYSLTGDHTMQSDYTLLRLIAGDDLHIEIKAADGRILYSEALTAKIMQNPAIGTQEALDRCDTFKLHYRIDKSVGGGWTITLVKINDWNVTGQGGGIG